MSTALTETGITHVLLDADGVLQATRGGWSTPFERWFGDRSLEFLETVGAVERTSLCGGESFRPALAAVVERFQVEAPVDDVYAVWLDIEVDETSMAIARELRDRGFGVHLATNQHAERCEHMRTVLGYDAFFDRSFYSCELGVAKPDPDYFRVILDELQVAASDVFFIDDSQENVDGARRVGLAAEQWQLEQGHDRLRSLLTQHLG